MDPGWVSYQLKVAQLYILFYEFSRQVQITTDLDWTSYHSFPEVKAGTVTPSPKALAVLSQPGRAGKKPLAYFINLPQVSLQPAEALSWAPFVQAYDDWFTSEWQRCEEFRLLRTFPAVMIILPGEDNVEAIENLVEVIQQKRQQPIRYFLTSWSYFFKDTLSLVKKPIWLQLTSEGKVLGQAHYETGSPLVKS